MHNMRIPLVVCALLLPCMPVIAGDPDPAATFSISDASGEPGDFVTVDVDISTNVVLQAWSFSLCHDDDFVAPTDVEIVVDGSYLFTSAEATEDGVKVIMLPSVETDGGVPAAEDESTTVVEVEYEILDGNDDEAEIEFCDTVGDPPVETIAVHADAGVDPTLESGVITVEGDGGIYFALPDTSVKFPAGNGSQSFVVQPTIVELGGSTETFGFSLAISHDDEYLSAVAVESSEALDELNDGEGPEFFTANTLDDGVTLGVVYTLEGDTAETFVFKTEIEVADIEYETNSDSLTGAKETIVTDLTWAEDLGDPPVDNLVVIDAEGATLDVATADGTVTLIPGDDIVFLRGDVNGDGDVSGLVDGLYLLQWGFMEDFALPPPPCDDATDANDDEKIAIIPDALFLMAWEFIAGATPPPTPGVAGCGVDPTGAEDEEDEELGCGEYDCP